MPSLPQRMRKLQTQLLAIRLGSGALVLPKDVQRLHMRFAERMEGGHMGSRKFWRHELIRLKYHNPAVPMTVERHTNNAPDSEAVMSIHFSPSQTSLDPTSANASTTTTAPPSAERIETINMKNLTNSQILTELVRITNAYPVEPTPEEQDELRMLEEQKLRGERDRRSSLEARARVKREQELLEQARGELAGQTN